MSDDPEKVPRAPAGQARGLKTDAITRLGTLLESMPGLPWQVRILARRTVQHAAATSDHLLVLADGLDEVAEFYRGQEQERPTLAVAAVAGELHRAAPAFAGEGWAG